MLRNWKRCQPGRGDFEIDRENPHASPMPPSQAALCALLATGAVIAEPARRHQLRNTCLFLPHSNSRAPPSSALDPPSPFHTQKPLPHNLGQCCPPLHSYRRHNRRTGSPVQAH